MRASSLSRLVVSVIVCCASLVLSLNSNGAAAAGSGTKPYFKVFGGDVFAGGAFNTVPTSSNCTGFANYYQSDQSAAGAGGIYAYSKDSGANSAGGASGQYGVFALGPIEGNSGSQYGFYSAGALANGSTAKDYLTFSNTTGGGVWGGNFDGNGGANLTHCIPDYYDMKKTSPTAGFPGFGSVAAGQQYAASGSPYQLDGGNVNTKFTLFVSGSVYINSDITYNAGATEDNVPKFALVVKGNIYVAPGVHRLDGLYIAQPTNTSSNDGIIWTCHDTDLSNNLSVWFNQNCGSKLTVNGAVVARQLNLMRVNGDVAGAAANEAAGSGNIAEEINYVPSMVIGGPFFSQNFTPYKVNSVINLPPVF
jgi:hypothetical protein